MAGAVTAAVGFLVLSITIPAEAAADGGCDPERLWRRCAVSQPVRESSPDSIVLRFEGVSEPRAFALASVPLRNAAARLRPRNAAIVEIGDHRGAPAVTGLGARPGWGLRLAVMLGIAALLGAAARLLPGGPAALALGADGPYSSSKWQMLVWFTVLVVAYGATLALRAWAGGIAYVGGVEIPARLFVLSGLSALTFAGARTIRQVKESRAARAAGGQAPTQAARPRPRFPADLVRDGSDPPDLARFQMVVVTVLAVAVYIVRVFGCLAQVELAATTSLPDVDTALLGGVGISQGAYLVNKAVAPLERG